VPTADEAGSSSISRDFGILHLRADSLSAEDWGSELLKNST